MSATDPIREWMAREPEEAAHPPALCRGCAGLGLSQGLSPRQMQMADGPFFLWDPEGKRRERCVRITPHVYHQGGAYHGPLALILAVLDELHSEGFEEKDGAPIPFGSEWRCDWCSGTGRPQLSAATLELLVRRQS
jgi:hypothetical protein